MRNLWYLGLLVLPASCTEQARSARPAVPVSTRYQPVACNFYRDRAGRLYEQRESARDEGATLETWYDSTVVVPAGDSAVVRPLANVIDLASYRDLGNSQFSKDRHRVYYSYANSGGGFRAVVDGADPATFRASPDYQYGFDARHGYYCDRQLPGLNVRRRQLLYGDTVAHFVAYVKDDQHVFYEAKQMPGADARTFHLVRGQEWEAEDKNHRYQDGGQWLRP